MAHIVVDGQKYLIINIHLDNVFEHNRKLQLQVIEKIIGIEKKVNENIIIMGDFNMTINGNLRDFCKRNNLRDAVPTNLGSSFREINREPIDHVLISKGLRYEDTTLITNKYNGVYPSDHFPVETKILIK